MELDSKIPPGPIDKKWTDHKGHIRIVNPANKRRIDVIVVGTGLAGGAAAASLAEQSYSVKAFCFQDSARRAQDHLLLRVRYVGARYAGLATAGHECIHAPQRV